MMGGKGLKKKMVNNPKYHGIVFCLYHLIYKIKYYET